MRKRPKRNLTKLLVSVLSEVTLCIPNCMISNLKNFFHQHSNSKNSQSSFCRSGCWAPYFSLQRDDDNGNIIMKQTSFPLRDFQKFIKVHSWNAKSHMLNLFISNSNEWKSSQRVKFQIRMKVGFLPAFAAALANASSMRSCAGSFSGYKVMKKSTLWTASSLVKYW